jgi:phosphomannomutase
MAESRQIPSHIFKSYDIRGVVDTEITESVAELIGAAAVETLAAQRVAVGRDMREHSPRLAAALIRGATTAGADVVEVGQCSTPMSYFAAATLDVDGAIMVTASHNPGRDNGFKFSKRGAEPMGMGSGLERVRDLVTSGAAAKIRSRRGRGRVEQVDLLSSWCTFLTQYLPDVRPMKIVADFGNGVMGPILGPLLQQVDPAGHVQLIPLFEQPDGTFPWHAPDPLVPANLRYLQGAVLATGADFGVAFDGDGDRLAFVDEKACFIGCDLMTALFARIMLREPSNRGKMVLYDLRSSRVVPEEIEAAGGIAQMCRVGHSHIKAAMRGRREGSVLDPSVTAEAVFAGELSGHFYYQDLFCIDSSERTFLLALQVMTEGGASLGERIAPLRRYHHSGEINFRFGDQAVTGAVLDTIERKYAQWRVFRLDGVSVQVDSWWLNVRPSNTEPVIRLTAESMVSAEALAQLVAEVEHLLAESGGTRKS